MPDDLPTLDERRDMYAQWRSKLNQRAADNRALVDEVAAEDDGLGDEWSPERLFAESRALDQPA